MSSRARAAGSTLRPGSPLRDLPGVGPVRARQLAEAGYRTVGDLLGHLPHRYEDRSTVRTVAEAVAAWRAEERGSVTLSGRLAGVRAIRVRRRGFSLVRGTLRDETGELPVVWFNRPYLARQADPETEYLLHGELRAPRGSDGDRREVRPELLNPSVEPVDRALHAGRVVPVYPAAGEIGPAAMRRLVDAALERLDPLSVPESLPEAVRSRHGLPPLGEALRDLHAPGPEADAAALCRRRSPAHRRLIYGELLEVQLALARLRSAREAHPKRHRHGPAARLAELAAELLPFRLTPGQERALSEIGADLARPVPMMRLLQGEVGCGKTAVAFLALVHAARSGLQGVLMAPTELLAEQHARNLAALTGGSGLRLALLTASNPELPAARQALARGEIDVAVGTHALIQERVAVPRLGLVVIDEQHRFGVDQRRRLPAKGARPDVLVMTATPIPRSLALTHYGELDLTAIDGLPPGRRPIATEVVGPAEREAVYERLARALDAGERAYVVFPRIGSDEDGEESDDGGGSWPALEREGAAVRRRLGVARTAVLHAGVEPEERARIVAALASGEVSALLATTVIEVGVDVPEASWMVIEGAERFGLAQLHQLRGRVGRGSRASRCIAIASRKDGERTEEGRRRLEVFAACSDGFRIAEEDLRIRGFGELLGTRQAGALGFRVADPVADAEWLEHARADAAAIVDRLGEPGFERLARRIERRLRRSP